MDNMIKGPVTSVPAASTSTPARVRLKRINCRQAQPYPPHGQKFEWWQRLKAALGTASSAFVNTSLAQLVSAARFDRDGLHTYRRHGDARKAGGRLCVGSEHPSDGTSSKPLLRAYAMQVEALRRLRNGGWQFVRVEHVHVNEGG